MNFLICRFIALEIIKKNVFKKEFFTNKIKNTYNIYLLFIFPKKKKEL